MKTENSKSDDFDHMNNSRLDHEQQVQDYDYTQKKAINVDISETPAAGFFKKSLLITKDQHNIGRPNAQESEATRKASTGPLIPPKFDGSSRRPSFLEQVLLPGIKCDAEVPTLSGDRSSKAQLTILYSGAVNVFDNVPLDKVQAILLLAGESSISAPIVTKVPDNIIDVKKALIPSNLPSVSKLQADLPIARKYSLQRFLKKRHDRIINKSPYAPSSTSKQKDD